ncbi:MAG: hypothetical protein JWO46_700, partial [Nocardioidaceae bacterium]|nr:hypothetical protein [Nocardioidaceae bacterium]
VALVFGAGIELLVVGSVDDDRVLDRWGLVALVAGVAGFFVLGYVRRVPMWIGSWSTGRHDVSDGRLPGESEPGVLTPQEDDGPGRPAR